MAGLHVPDEVVAFELDSTGLRRLLDYLLEQGDSNKAAMEALRRDHALELEGMKKELERISKVEEDVKVCFDSLQRVDGLSVSEKVGKDK